MKLTRENYKAWIAHHLEKGTPKEEIIGQLKDLDGLNPRPADEYEMWVTDMMEWVRKAKK